MSEDRRQQPEPPKFRTIGTGMHVNFMCCRCNVPKLIDGRREMPSGVMSCYGCLTPAERRSPKGKAIYGKKTKRVPEPRVVLDWKAPQR